MNPDTIERMQKYGGMFAQCLAEAWLHADEKNRARLEAAFADLFAKYSGGA